MLVVIFFVVSIFAQSDFEARKGSAETGDAIARNNLGLMYANGEGIQQNYAEVVLWYRLAAEQGYINVQSSLEFMPGAGRGIERNKSTAYI